MRLDGILSPPSRLIGRRRERVERRAPWRLLEGRPFAAQRRRIAVLTPFIPSVDRLQDFQRAAREFDIVVFAFADRLDADCSALLECCARVILVGSRGSGRPKRIMRFLWEGLTREFEVNVRQVESVTLASLGGDLLVVESAGLPAVPWRRWLREREQRRAAGLFRRVISHRGGSRMPVDIYRELIEPPVTVRRAVESDVDDLDRIQRLCAEAVIWEAHTYLSYDCRVAETDGCVCGFVVTRTLPGGECEVLSLVVDPASRRRGIGTRLMREVLAEARAATWYLEVRESNWAARNLYTKLGFEAIGTRANYYQDTGETAVVMRLQSC